MKKALSLILALTMIASCVFVLVSCGGGKYDGEYKYKSAKFNKYILAGQDISKMFNADDFDVNDSIDIDESTAVIIDGHKITFKDEDDDKEYSFTEKDGKLILDQKFFSDLMSATDVFKDAEIYFKVNGDDLDMYVCGSIEVESMEIEFEVVASFKKQ